MSIEKWILAVTILSFFILMWKAFGPRKESLPLGDLKLLIQAYSENRYDRWFTRALEDAFVATGAEVMNADHGELSFKPYPDFTVRADLSSGLVTQRYAKVTIKDGRSPRKNLTELVVRGDMPAKIDHAANVAFAQTIVRKIGFEKQGHEWRPVPNHHNGSH